MKRVVMGEPSPGMSVFTDVTELEPLQLSPNKARYFVWGCDELPQYPHMESEPYVPRSHFPPPGGVRVFVEENILGDGSAETDQHKRAQEEAARLFAAEPNGRVEGSKPGMHRTNGLYIGVVISGEMTVTAEDGTSQVLGPGDFYIQPGAMHQWHPNPDNPPVMAFVAVQRENPQRES